MLVLRSLRSALLVGSAVLLACAQGAAPTAEELCDTIGAYQARCTDALACELTESRASCIETHREHRVEYLAALVACYKDAPACDSSAMTRVDRCATEAARGLSLTPPQRELVTAYCGLCPAIVGPTATPQSCSAAIDNRSYDSATAADVVDAFPVLGAAFAQRVRQCIAMVPAGDPDACDRAERCLLGPDGADGGTPRPAACGADGGQEPNDPDASASDGSVTDPDAAGPADAGADARG